MEASNQIINDSNQVIHNGEVMTQKECIEQIAKENDIEIHGYKCGQRQMTLLMPINNKDSENQEEE